MGHAVGALDVSDGKPTSDALLAAAEQDSPDEDPVDGLVRRVLLAMLEERRTRRPGWHVGVGDAGVAAEALVSKTVGE